MTTQESILAVLSELPSEKIEEVLEFAKSLKSPTPGRPPKSTLRGLWRDLDVHLTEDEISDARREMWERFPRRVP
jgi:hypothetical protein